jgi:hypothetical protein
MKQAARRVGQHDWLDKAARVGYAVNGLLHLLIAWIAIQIAIGSSGDSADQSGALSHLSNNTFGRIMLWIAVVGFVGLTILQLTKAIAGTAYKASDRLKEGSKAIVYAALAWTAFNYAKGDSSNSEQQINDFTASLMAKPLGMALVALIGVVIIGIGVYHVNKGWKKKFISDLDQHPGTFFVRSGQIGYIARGVALFIVGGLFVLAAINSNPAEAGGLDAALRSLTDEPFGRPLLALIAFGFAAFGVYSFARAKHANV